MDKERQKAYESKKALEKELNRTIIELALLNFLYTLSGSGRYIEGFRELTPENISKEYTEQKGFVKDAINLLHGKYKKGIRKLEKMVKSLYNISWNLVVGNEKLDQVLGEMFENDPEKIAKAKATIIRYGLTFLKDYLHSTFETLEHLKEEGKIGKGYLRKFIDGLIDRVFKTKKGAAAVSAALGAYLASRVYTLINTGFPLGASLTGSLYQLVTTILLPLGFLLGTYKLYTKSYPQREKLLKTMLYEWIKDLEKITEKSSEGEPLETTKLRVKAWKDIKARDELRKRRIKEFVKNVKSIFSNLLSRKNEEEKKENDDILV